MSLSLLTTANGSVTMLTFFEDEEDGFLEDFRTETGVSWLDSDLARLELELRIESTVELTTLKLDL